VGGAGGGLEEGGVDVGEVLDGEDAAGWRISSESERVNWGVDGGRLTRISTILGEATVHSDPMSFKVLAEQQLATTAVEAFTAELGVVCTDSFSNLEAFHVLAHGCDDTDGLMAGDERELGQKLSFVDMQVCAADAAGLDFDEDIIVSEFGEVDFDNAVFLRLGVPMEKKGFLAKKDGRKWC
jgi:hypothetical protein